jgi:hypothetical protein
MARRLLDPCRASSFLTFGLSIGYAAPLLDILGEDEGAIFHLYGYSSTGKTLIAKSIHSQAGRARNADLATSALPSEVLRNSASRVMIGSLSLTKRDARAGISNSAVSRSESLPSWSQAVAGQSVPRGWVVAATCRI